MFNAGKIGELESAVKFLERERDHHRDKIWRLEKHIEVLTEHLGLKIEELPPRTIIATLANTELTDRRGAGSVK